MAVRITGGANNYLYTLLTGLSSSRNVTMFVRFRYNSFNAIFGSPLMLLIDGVGAYTGVYVADGADQLLIANNVGGDTVGGTLRRGFTHTACVTVDGSGNATAFVNGEPVATDTAYSSFTPAYILAGGSDNLSTDGVVQDLMVWNHALKLDEIRKQHFSRRPVTRLGLVNWHPMSHRSRVPGGANTTIFDWPRLGSEWAPSSANYTFSRDLTPAGPIRRRGLIQVPAAGSQTIEPPLLTNTSTLYGATVTPGAVTLSSPLLTDSDTLYAPTLTVGSVTVAPPLLTNAQTFYAPTVSAGTVTVAPPLLDSSAALYAPTVSPGSVTIAPPLIDASAVLYEPVVSNGGVTLLMPLLDSSAVLYAPTVTGAQLISPPLITETTTLYPPTITAGSVTIEPPRIDASAVLYEPVVSYGATTIAPPLLDNANVLFAPTVVAGSVTVFVPLLTNGSELYPPAVYDGEVPPEPEAPATSGVPGGRRAPSVRCAVRIDGELFVGTYAQISQLVASLGARDALDELASTDEAPRSKRTARVRARKAAGSFDRSMQVIDITVPAPTGVDPAPIAQRDLREEYLRAYAAAMLNAQRSADEQARVEAEIEADDLDAINRLLDLL